METESQTFTVALDGSIPGLFVVGVPHALHEKRTPGVLAPLYVDHNGQYLVPIGCMPWEPCDAGAEIRMLVVDATEGDLSRDGHVVFERMQARCNYAVLVVGPREREHKEQILQHTTSAADRLAWEGLFSNVRHPGLVHRGDFVLWYADQDVLKPLRSAVWRVAHDELVAALRRKSDAVRPLAFWLHRAATSLPEAALAAAALESAKEVYWPAILGSNTEQRMAQEQRDAIEAGRAELRSILGN